MFEDRVKSATHKLGNGAFGIFSDDTHHKHQISEKALEVISLDLKGGLPGVYAQTQGGEPSGNSHGGDSIERKNLTLIGSSTENPLRDRREQMRNKKVAEENQAEDCLCSSETSSTR